MILSLCQPDYVSETSVFTPAASAQTFGLGGVTGRKQVLPKSMEQQQSLVGNHGGQQSPRAVPAPWVCDLGGYTGPHAQKDPALLVLFVKVLKFFFFFFFNF